jgi:hypothetical protein
MPPTLTHQPLFLDLLKLSFLLHPPFLSVKPFSHPPASASHFFFFLWV